MRTLFPKKICGREFVEEELAIIKRIIETSNPPLREEIARQVCKELNWQDNLGRYKVMSCKVALLRLHRADIIKLPPPRNGNGNGKEIKNCKIKIDKKEVILPAGKLSGLSLEAVKNKDESNLWNTLIARYHYLGYTPLPGAQKRYIIKSDEGILGAIGFSAAAWKIKPRDNWIKWDSSTREKNLHLVINNSRFLILPWIRSKNLASKILSICSKRIADDFYYSYGYYPVLLETFVESGRFSGTSYRAANWQYLGKTQGRGKLDRYKQRAVPVKDIYLYPLDKRFRKILGGI